MRNRAVVWAPVLAAVLVGTLAAALMASPEGLEADIRDLASEDATVRNAAIAKLEQGSSAVVGPLVDALSDEHAPIVKGSIARIVAKLGVTSSDAADLKALLTSSDAAARGAAITILQTKPTLATQELLGLAEDADELPALRASAAVALGGAGDSARGSLGDLAADSDLPASVRHAAMRGLAASSIDGAKDVKRIGQDRDLAREDRLAAVTALGNPSCMDHAQLTPLCVEGPAWLRARALAALAGSGSGQSHASIFAGRLQDLSPDVRMAALRGLQEIGKVAANKVAIKGLVGDADARVNAKAIELTATSYVGTPNAVQALLRGQLANANFHVRHEAATALFSHGDKTGAATMQADALTPNLSQQKTAQAAYSRISGK